MERVREFLNVILDKEIGDIPHIDLDFEKNLHEVILEGTDNHLFESCHDCSCGGLAVSLAESCMSSKGNEIGATINIDSELPINSLLFGETQSRVVVSLNESKVSELEAICKKHNFPYAVIGKVGGDSLTVNDKIDLSLTDMVSAWRNSIADALAVEIY